MQPPGQHDAQQRGKRACCNSAHNFNGGARLSRPTLPFLVSAVFCLFLGCIHAQCPSTLCKLRILGWVGRHRQLPQLVAVVVSGRALRKRDEWLSSSTQP